MEQEKKDIIILCDESTLDKKISINIIKSFILNKALGDDKCIKSYEFKSSSFYYDLFDSNKTKVDFDNTIVYLIGFIPKNIESLLSLKNRYHKVIWITHTDNFVLKYLGDQESHIVTRDTIYGIRSTEFSTCNLVWQYLFRYKYMPKFVFMIGRSELLDENKVIGKDYDINQCVNELNVLFFKYGIQSFSNEHIEKIISEVIIRDNYDYDSMVVETIINNGKIVLEFLSKKEKKSNDGVFGKTLGLFSKKG